MSGWLIVGPSVPHARKFQLHYCPVVSQTGSLIQIIEIPYYVEKEYLVGNLTAGGHLELCGEFVSVEDLFVYHCILK